MMTGIVNEKLEATVRVTIVGPAGQMAEVTAVVDTGYNGVITLPLAVVSALTLPQGASREVTLGDSKRYLFDYYNAEIIWDSTSRKERVLCTEGDPLIGTALLEGYKMDADFVRNGPVIFSPVSLP